MSALISAASKCSIWLSGTVSQIVQPPIVICCLTQLFLWLWLCCILLSQTVQNLEWENSEKICSVEWKVKTGVIKETILSSTVYYSYSNVGITSEMLLAKYFLLLTSLINIEVVWFYWLSIYCFDVSCNCFYITTIVWGQIYVAIEKTCLHWTVTSGNIILGSLKASCSVPGKWVL